MGNLDGSGPPTDLFTQADGLEGPHALALDLTNQKIYWADGLTRKIQVGNMDGSGTPTDLFTQADGLIVPIRLVLR
jgi:hypothetical protein